MKYIIYLFLLLSLTTTSIAANKFNDLDVRTKIYIIETVSGTISNSDIAILHGRRDETYRRKDAPLDIYHEIPLGLRRWRFIAMLKGFSSLKNNEVVYIYIPERSAPGRTFTWNRYSPPPPYRPQFSCDDLMRLVFIQRQTFPLKNRILAGYREREQMTQFIDDALAMDEADLMEKYNLKDVFAHYVYQLMEGCVFQVDYPIPEMPVTESMRMNWDNWQLTKAHTPEVQKHSNLVHLSNREISEIVFIAYMLDGEASIAKYAEACADNDQILVPISEPVFETEIGKMLFDAVSKNAGTNAN
ncbi:MAG: hypothetical protein LC725_09695 [Lentisphaerae bacterium]|nr:hypothetical protein [Lentisphaerota bacterium]